MGRGVAVAVLVGVEVCVCVGKGVMDNLKVAVGVAVGTAKKGVEQPARKQSRRMEVNAITFFMSLRGMRDGQHYIVQISACMSNSSDQR